MRRIGHKSRVLVVNDALIALVAGAAMRRASSSSPAPDRSSTGATPAATRRGPAGGDTSSATRAAATGSAARRWPPSCAPRTAAGPRRAHRRCPRALRHRRHVGLPRIVYDRELPRVNVAALGPIVQRAASAATLWPTRILERAADELVAGGAIGRDAARDARGRLYVRPGGRCLPRRAVAGGGVVTTASRSGAAVRGPSARREPAAGAVWLALAEARGGARVPTLHRVTRDDSGLFSTPRPAGAVRSPLDIAARRRRQPAPRSRVARPAARRFRSIASSWRFTRAAASTSRARPRSTSTSSSASRRTIRGSYRAFMQRHLFDRINLPPRRIHFLNGAARDRPRNATATSAQSRGPAASICRSWGLASTGTSASTNRRATLAPRTHRTR